MRPEKILEALTSITDIANQSRISFESKLERILLQIVDCMDTRIGSLMLIKSRKELEVVASTNPALIGMRQPTNDNSHSAWVVRNKQPLYSRDLQNQGFFTNNFERYKKEAFFIAPILFQNKIIGVLNVTERVGPDSFTIDEKKSLLAIAGHLICSIETHRLSEELKKKNTELKKSYRNQKQEQHQRIMKINQINGIEDMDIRTHQKIDPALCGNPVKLEDGVSCVEMKTLAEMIVDNKGLVHGGFVFGLADHAAMIAVNDPNVVLGAADVKFLKPVRADEVLVAEAKIVEDAGKKRIVLVTVTRNSDIVFEGSFICFVLDKHVLD